GTDTMFPILRRYHRRNASKGRRISHQPQLELLEDRTLLSVDLAYNPARTGYPTPLESDRGWGGGSDQWEIVDGQRHYDYWAHGLAFTGGHTGDWNSPGWVEPAGPRQATIDFGINQTFNEVIIWHHGDATNHVPAETAISYWNGSQWNAIAVTRVYGTMHEEGSN